MDVSPEYLKEIAEWRREKKLVQDDDTANFGKIERKKKSDKFHFMYYDPDLADTDISSFKLIRDETKDPAVFSIPHSFTEKHATNYKQHDNVEFGLDIRTSLTPHNAPVLPNRN